MKGGTWQIDDVVTYDSNELAQIGRAVLAEYGAKHVVIEKALLSSSNGERLRRVADAMLGETSMVYDEIITAYHVTPPASPPSQTLWLDTGWSYLEQSGESDPLVCREPALTHSDRSACMTSTRAARAAGSTDATTAATRRMTAAATTGSVPGICTSRTKLATT